MASVIRPVVNVFDGSNKIVGEVPMQAVFQVSVRPDLVEAVHTNMAKNHRQPYAVSPKAGHQTSAESWGTGRAVARIPRVSGSGTHRAGQAAFGNMCRGGRMFAPTKIWRKWHVRTNQNEKRFATCSAIAASAVAPLVLARGHKIEQISEVPLIVSSDVEKIQKTKEAVSVLKGLNAYSDIQKVIDSKTLRAGKGKMRNRRYRQRRGPLIVFNKDEGITRAFRNIPGVELCNVKALNLLTLAPGGHLGRFVIWTQEAFASLDSIYGTYSETSPKKNFILPHPKVSNPDIKRLINSEEIQAVIRPAKKSDKIKAIRGNPLVNKKLMYKLNPYAAQIGRLERLHQKKVAAIKASGKNYAQVKKEDQAKRNEQRKAQKTGSKATKA